MLVILQRTRSAVIAALCTGYAFWPAPLAAERIENEVAVFAALDKVTAQISKLEIPLGQSATFGSLKVTPRVCYSRPATEKPKTTTFVEIGETTLEGQQKRIFTGWMFAENPALNAVAHPIFDVWLTGCDKPRKPLARYEQAPGAGSPASAQPGSAQEEGDPFGPPRRRIRR